MVKKSAKGKPQRFHMESLEARELMAGDLFVAAAGGNLLITDYNIESNVNSSVQVKKISPNQVQVTGLVDAYGQQTFINGKTSDVFAVDVAGVLTVNMGGGHDTLQVLGGTYSGVFINMDHHQIPQYGQDKVFFTNVTTTGSVQIQTGDGSDLVDIFGTTVGDGVEDMLLVNTGDGSDEVRVNSTVVRGDLSVATYKNFAQNATDKVTMTNVAAARNFTIGTGAGNDTVDLYRVYAGPFLTIATGHDEDTVRLREVNALDTIYTLLGDGDDKLEVSGCRALSLKLYGEAGHDTLTMTYQPNSQSNVINGFEPASYYFSMLGNTKPKAPLQKSL